MCCSTALHDMFVSRSDVLKDLCSNTDKTRSRLNRQKLALVTHGINLVCPRSKHDFGRVDDLVLAAEKAATPSHTDEASDEDVVAEAGIRRTHAGTSVLRRLMGTSAKLSKKRHHRGWTGDSMKENTIPQVDETRHVFETDEDAEEAIEKLYPHLWKGGLIEEDDDDDDDADDVPCVYTEETEFLPVGMGNFKTNSLPVKMKQFEWFMRLLDDLPAALGTEDEPYTRKLQQRLMHIPMINALAKVVFRDEFESVLPDLQAKFGIYPSRCVIGVIASRQVGKTTAAAIFLLALAIAFPQMNAVVACTCQRTSNQTIDTMKGFRTAYETKHGKKFEMEYDCVKSMVFKGNGSRVTAMPSSPDRVRGIKPDVFYFDEVTHGDPDMLSKLAFPLLKLNRCAILTGTPSDSPENHFAKLCEAQWMFGSLIELVDLSLVCKECVQRGVVDTCIHRQYLAPEELESMRQAFIRTLVTTIAPAEVAMAEMMGVRVEANDHVFQHAAVERLRNSAPVLPVFQHGDQPMFAWMAMDPSGGGPSDTALISGFSIPGAPGLMPNIVVRNITEIPVLHFQLP